MGAILGAEVFDPESDKSLGASEPESDSRNSPSARNFSTEPMYSDNDKDASK